MSWKKRTWCRQRSQLGQKMWELSVIRAGDDRLETHGTSTGEDVRAQGFLITSLYGSDKQVVTSNVAIASSSHSQRSQQSPVSKWTYWFTLFLLFRVDMKNTKYITGVFFLDFSLDSYRFPADILIHFPASPPPPPPVGSHDTNSSVAFRPFGKLVDNTGCPKSGWVCFTSSLPHTHTHTHTHTRRSQSPWSPAACSSPVTVSLQGRVTGTETHLDWLCLMPPGGGGGVVVVGGGPEGRRLGDMYLAVMPSEAECSIVCWRTNLCQQRLVLSSSFTLHLNSRFPSFFFLTEE